MNVIGDDISSVSDPIPTISVCLIEDDNFFRAALERRIKQEPGFDMPTFVHNDVTRLAITGMLAFSVGYLIPRNTDSDPISSVRRSQPGISEAGRVPGRVEGGRLMQRPETGNRTADEGVPGNGLALRLGITPEDWAATKEMNERAERGEYVLRFQRPTTRKFLAHDFKEIVAETARASSAEYDQIFSQMGIDPAIGEQLKLHASQIHQASLEAKVMIQQLIAARNDYDARVRTLLGEDQYRSYRQYEEGKPAARELTRIYPN